MGLKNVEIRHQSILDFPDTEGKFDYIIAHGFYSWVPAAVQEKIRANEIAERTQRQWIGDGSVPEGTDEWPALLRSLEN